MAYTTEQISDISVLQTVANTVTNILNGQGLIAVDLRTMNSDSIAKLNLTLVNTLTALNAIVVAT